MKIYITGVAGTGKSSIIKELNKRGIKAFDVDSREFCYWIDKEGKRTKYEVGIGREWIESHEYLCDKEKLKSFIDSQKDELVFISGIADNQNEYLDWFDKIFVLQCNKNILLNRLINRDTNNFAKEKSEQESVLDMQKDFNEDMIKNGAVAIDSNDDVIKVTDKILSYL